MIFLRRSSRFFEKNPLSLAALDSSPEGRTLGKTGRSRPHYLTTNRSLPLSCKLSAPAKASPFRERWHGEAVTERVGSIEDPSQSPALDSAPPFCRLAGEGAFGTNPFRHFALRNATSPEGGGLGKEDKSRPHYLTTKRSLPLSCKLSAPAKASPEGRALGKEGEFCPHRSTTRTS